MRGCQSCKEKKSIKRAGYAFHTPANTRKRLLCRGEARPALNKVWGIHFSPLAYIIHQLAKFLKVTG